MFILSIGRLDLGFGIILNCQLPIIRVLDLLAAKLIESKELKKLNDILNRAKV
jgi:hypothetical protein